MIAGPYLNSPFVELVLQFGGKSDALWISNQGLSIGCLNC
jgi:hypothetical protein